MSLILSLRSSPLASLELEGACRTCGQRLDAQVGLPLRRRARPARDGGPGLSPRRRARAARDGDPGLVAWRAGRLSLRSATLWLGVTIPLIPLLSLASWGQSPESRAPLGELFATFPGAPAAAQLAGTGMSVVSGSELTAGMAPATLKLVRGGQVRICPQTNLTINEAATGLMLGMGTGAVEIDYRLGQGGSDVLITPDFSVRLVGPNTYHFAFGVSGRGDTCFKPLSGNTAGVLLSEVMGADSYGTAPNEAMVFSGGKLAGRGTPKEDCGCPAPVVLPVLQAETQPVLNQHPGGAISSEPAPNRDPTAPLPAARPGEAPVVVATPFVFSAAAQPASVARLQLSSLPNTVFLQDEPEPVVLVEKQADVSAQDSGQKPDGQTKKEKEKEEPKKESKGFMARLKGLFGSLFHR